MVAQTVTIQDQTAVLGGLLAVPSPAVGVVLFAHGSGSGRFSPRNRLVAQSLQKAGIATLLIDLLTTEEAEARHNVFDINLLAERVLTASAWLCEAAQTKRLPLGYFGASTGADAALQAAAQARFNIHGIVSRGGRPDLAEDYLPQVTAPTLLLVGGEDHAVIQLNQFAYRLLRCPKKLIIIPGATHLFEEPGTLAEVARLAAAWFSRYLTPQTTPAGERPQRHS